MNLFLTQLLNGLQVGVLLFLLAAGLTLVFGIMNFVNLAHGSLYMLGAFLAAWVFQLSGSFVISALVAIPGTMLLGVLLERSIFARLYQRDHLYQVLCTFGIILISNEIVQIIWGSAPLFVATPATLVGTVELFSLPYPRYRFAIIGVGVVTAIALYVLIHRTRTGMLIRAGALNPKMVAALGVNIRRLKTLIFALGAALAAVAGVMAGPIISVQSGMGEPILVLTLVVIVTGGIGSIKGAFLGALIVGVADTLGRAFLPLLLGAYLDRSVAQATGAALASMLIYLLMAGVLSFRPQGLFPVRR